MSTTRHEPLPASGVAERHTVTPYTQISVPAVAASSHVIVVMHSPPEGMPSGTGRCSSRAVLPRRRSAVTVGRRASESVSGARAPRSDAWDQGREPRSLRPGQASTARGSTVRPLLASDEDQPEDDEGEDPGDHPSLLWRASAGRRLERNPSVESRQKLSRPRLMTLLEDQAGCAHTTRRPRTCRAMTSRWIWLVPSPISVSFASRR